MTPILYHVFTMFLPCTTQIVKHWAFFFGRAATVDAPKEELYKFAGFLFKLIYRYVSSRRGMPAKCCTPPSLTLSRVYLTPNASWRRNNGNTTLDPWCSS
jgi:hypothetical protein